MQWAGNDVKKDVSSFKSSENIRKKMGHTKVLAIKADVEYESVALIT